MSLPELQLDDRDFQSLVDEARLRIAHTCPEWNEHNVSDPGITLIELFAWMTDQLVYRVNRVPEKVQIALLDLLGIQLAAARAATTELRFRLAAPPKVRLVVPVDRVEVGASGHKSGEPIVFRTVEPIVVPPLRLGRVLFRGREIDEVPVRGGVRPSGPEPRWLSGPSRPDHGLYLGFHSPLTALVVAVTVAAEPARGTGIEPDTPPWTWEVSAGRDTWAAATVLSDETWGFNRGSGAIELQLPRTGGLETLHGHRLHWLRCRLRAAGADEAEPSGYTHVPMIKEIRAEAVGVLAEAEHAQAIEMEILGYSDGSPGQVFPLRHRPTLPLGEHDGLDVLDAATKEWVPWELRESFADSGSRDHHYCFDPVAGEVALGPAIREPDGWVQRGAIPGEGVALRMRRYSRGGGTAGNVGAGTLTVLRKAFPGIASVTNPVAASGGFDPESLTQARRRAGIELRTRFRAVTVEDYELLAYRASPGVARVRCVEPETGQAVAVRILPVVPHPSGPLSFADLQPSDPLLTEVAHFLDQSRTIGTCVHVTPLALRGVTVVAELVLDPATHHEQVEGLVAAALYRYVNPYVGGSLAGQGDGWEFGRALPVKDVQAVVREVPGVLEISLLRLYATDLATGKPDGQPVADRLEIGPDELVASATHRIRSRRPDTP
jgi:baseplate J-like protein